MFLNLLSYDMAMDLAHEFEETADQMFGVEELYLDILRFGCLRAFRHFLLYLRGREELLVTVRTVVDFASPTSKKLQVRPTWRNHERQVCQRPLPPASPANAELKQTYAGETLFLIGAYARYRFCPYVWLRSQHCAPGFDPNAPLLLETTKSWENDCTLRIWDVIEELVRRVSPNCKNPFEIDFDALKDLPPLERVSMAAATASFLKTLLKKSSYAASLKWDLRNLLELHFNDLPSIFMPLKAESTRTSESMMSTTHYRI